MTSYDNSFLQWRLFDSQWDCSREKKTVTVSATQGWWKQLKSGPAPNTKAAQRQIFIFVNWTVRKQLSAWRCAVNSLMIYLRVHNTFEYSLLDHRKVVRPKPDHPDRFRHPCYPHARDTVYFSGIVHFFFVLHSAILYLWSFSLKLIWTGESKQRVNVNPHVFSVPWHLGILYHPIMVHTAASVLSREYPDLQT